MAKKTIHMEMPEAPEYTVCGIAEDAFESDHHDEKVYMAQRGDLITCEACRKIITAIKKVRRWRAPE